MLFESFQPYSDCEPAGVKLPKIQISNETLSQLSLPENSTSFDVLKALARKGIKEKGIDKYPNKKEYYDRAKYELDTFEELGFTDYVLLNWEIIGYAKSVGVPVGEGRGCLSEDSLIRTKQGLKRIDEISICDEVLNGFGEWSKILQKHKYKCDESLIGFSINGSSHNYSKFTPDHKILVVKNPFGEFPVRKGGIKGFREKFNKIDFQWLRADEISPGDYLVRFHEPISEVESNPIDLKEWSDNYSDEQCFLTYRKNKESILSIKTIAKKIKVSPSTLKKIKTGSDKNIRNEAAIYKLQDYLRQNNLSFDSFVLEKPTTTKVFRRFIDSEDFYYFLGFYIGDGSSKDDHISLALNSEKDKPQIKWFENFCEKYGFEKRLDKQKNKKLIKFIILNRALVKETRKYCPGKTQNYTKKICFDSTLLNKKDSMALFRGMLDSDGSEAENRICFDNTNYSFIHLFRRLGEKLFSTSSNIAMRPKNEIKSLKRDSFKCRLTNKETKNTKIIKKDRFCLNRVNRVLNFENKSGFVYDLSIDGNSPSYSVEDFSVHNSAAGSLILYLLNITEKDPIKYDLIFERFVSKSRAKKITDIRGEVFLDGSLVPDVDSDFSYDRRAEVIKFIEDKHAGRTAKILTFNTFTSKLCIREAVKYFDKASEEEANVISDMIPKKHGIVASLEEAGGLSERFKGWVEKNQFVFSEVKKVEDLIKNAGVHPSGIAIASCPIVDIAPIQRTKEGDLVVSYDMKDAADLMVKFDILGLRTLTIADLACKKIEITLANINAEDPFIYEKLQNFNHPAGLFQISAETNFKVTQDVKPVSLDELSDVVALARPGALEFVGEYVRQKHFPTSLGIYKELDDILFPTKNIFLYQETLMLACHKIFGFSLLEAESLRRIIGKKLVDEMPAWENKIYEAAKEKNIPKSAADYFWNAAKAAANYSFNKSHSFCYSSLAAKTVYLKYKYPKEFFCSILETAEFSPDPLQVIAEVNRELPDFGIRLLPPDLQKSKLSFTIEDNGIRYGLSSIKGISGNIQNALKEFVKLEPKNKYDVFIGAKQCGINIGVLSSLIYAGALGEENRSKTVLEAQCFNLLTDREKRNIYQLGEKYKYDLLTSIAEISQNNMVGDDNKPIFKESRFQTFKKKFEPYKTLYFENKQHECLAAWWFEKTLLGYSYTHKLRDCFNQSGDLLELKEVLEDKPESWRSVGQIDDFFVKTSQNGNRYAKIRISDDSATTDLMFCDGKKEKKLTDFLDKSKLSKGSIILVKAQSSGSTNFVDSIRVIDTKIYTKIRELK